MPTLEGFEPLVKYRHAVTSRRHDLTLERGARLLTKHKSELGDLVWGIHEEVLLAAAVLGQHDWMDFCHDELRMKFPTSKRVQRLDGFVLESKGKFAEAQCSYLRILEENPEDMVSRHRIISMYKKQQKVDVCIRSLNEHLAEYATDQHAWKELGKIYMRQLQLQKAAYCFEDVLLREPRNCFSALLLGQIYFALNDWLTSRKYFCHVMDVKLDNGHAQWGYLMCEERINRSTVVWKKSAVGDVTNREQETKKHSQLRQLVVNRLEEKYEEGEEHKDEVTTKSVMSAVLKNFSF